MSRYYMTSSNSRGNPVTAAGAESGQSTHARGWHVGAVVVMRPQDDNRDKDECVLWATSGSSADFSRELLGTLTQDMLSSGLKLVPSAWLIGQVKQYEKAERKKAREVKAKRARLEAFAEETAHVRGHKLGPWIDPAYAKLGVRASADCLTCGRSAEVDTAPAPNGIDIGGEVFALDCRANTLAEMETIYMNGMQDEVSGDVESPGGHFYRVGNQLVITDSQGFRELVTLPNVEDAKVDFIERDKAYADYDAEGEAI